MDFVGDIKRFVISWNSDFPIDYWWRAKYNIPFGSPSHLDMDMIDMRVQFEEIEMFKSIAKEFEKRRDEEEDKMLGLTKDNSSVKKSVVSMSKKEIDEEFNNLDLSQFNDKKS